MKAAFYTAAIAMVALALFLTIRPLIQAGLRQKSAQGLFAIALAIAVLLPVVTIYLYRLLGTPQALDAQSFRNAHAPAGVQTKAEAMNGPVFQNPVVQNNARDDSLKWMAAARAYDIEKRPLEARDLYAKVLQVDVGNTAAMVGWVEADMTQHADYSIDASSRRLLERAIALEPDNQRALWLLGISDFQRENYAQASATWRHLQRLLDSHSALTQSVAQQIAIADARAKIPTSSAPLLR